MNIALKASLREKGKKSDRNQLRNKGFIPAVIYGEEFENKLISIDEIDFRKAYKKSIGELAFFDISVDDGVHKTIIKDKQIHPLSREVLHVDFQILHEGKPINVEIPIKFVGDPKGAETGGILEITTRTLEVNCLPKDIVEDIEVDVSHLEIGDAIHLSDLDIGNMDTKFDDNRVLAVMQAPKKAEEEEEAEGAEEEVEETEV